METTYNSPQPAQEPEKRGVILSILTYLKYLWCSFCGTSKRMVENDKIGDKTHINKHNIIPGLCEQDRSDLKYWEQRIQVYSTPLVIISQEKRREENINSNTQSRLFDKKFETLRGSEILSIEEYQKIKEWSLKTGLFYFQVKKHQWDLDV